MLGWLEEGEWVLLRGMRTKHVGVLEVRSAAWTGGGLVARRERVFELWNVLVNGR